MKNIILSISILFVLNVFGQSNPPWGRPLNIAYSNDGLTFNTPLTFQDSSGVPSVIRWKGDTLICAFQWFRLPIGSSTFDKVAIKFSYDNGLTWTLPTPANFIGIPSNYTRPFDPTLVIYNSDSIRMYFSSTEYTLPLGNLDSTVNTYSAVSIDGVNFTLESNPRVDELNNRVIDPAVIYFKNGYHFSAPIGAPQDGAYHYVSPNGINFNKVSDITSDAFHNWTGNFMVNDTNELRFYGTANAAIWYNSTSNGGVWNGFVNTNILGGDPSVLKVDQGSYLMIFVGLPYTTNVDQSDFSVKMFTFYPNPVKSDLTIKISSLVSAQVYEIIDINGRIIASGNLVKEIETISVSALAPGTYCLNLVGLGKKVFVVQ